MKLLYLRLAKNYWPTYQGYLKSCDKDSGGIFTLIYEELKQDPLQWTKKMRDFLRKVYPNSIPNREDCFKDLEGDFHRTKKKNPDYSWIKDKLLSKADLKYLNDLKFELLNNSVVKFPESYQFY